MKEASGELNMTIITLVAITAVGALLYFIIWPFVQQMVVDKTCKTYGTSYAAKKVDGVAADNGDADVSKWKCCPKTADGWDETKCVDVQ